MNIMKYCGTILLLSALFAFTATSQDTLTLSLRDAETRFLNENLILMAEHLELDIQDLEIRKAGLWNNPEFEVEHQIINREGRGPVGFTGRDNTVFGIEQLFITAGKRGHRIRLQELDKLRTEQQLNLLIRTFILTLREEYIRLAYLNRIEGLYQRQIDALEIIFESSEGQYQMGNIPRLEIIRLRSLLLELEKEYNEILEEQMESRQSLKILLHLEDQIPVPELPEDPWQATGRPLELNLDDLYEMALESRGDIRSTLIAVNAAERSLLLEQANQWPDLGIGLGYDRLDGFVENYFGIGFSIQLPLWNRNRENIRIATHRIRQSELMLTQQQLELRHVLESAVNRVNRAQRLYERTELSYENEFGEIIQALTLQYQRGDIRLIEFVDFYESFREGVIRKYTVREDLLRAAEELNFMVGLDVFEFIF
jgi:outer membrane protein, heavy metal efflux system